MSVLNIQIADDTDRTLQALAQQTGSTVPEILERAIEDYRRKVFFAGVHEDFARLKADPQAWAEELAERKLFENTLMDGIEPEDEPQ